MMRFSLAALALLLTGPPLWAQASCQTAIRDFQRVIDADAQTGNLNKAVHARIGPQLAPVNEACRAGREADALRRLHALKDRYGYR